MLVLEGILPVGARNEKVEKIEMDIYKEIEKSDKRNGR